MKLETVKIADLHSDPKNARKHNKANIEAIMNSLKEFGQRRPLVVAEGNSGELVVIAGNGTMDAASKLGWTEIEITKVPQDWDYDRARAYALADNRTAELAEWDDSVLADQLLELEAAGWSINELGFGTATIDDDEEVVQDEVPEVLETPLRTRAGELWILGDHRLLVGDSTKVDDFNKLMENELADCVFTDPPYNVAYTGGTKEKLTIENDSMSESDFSHFLHEAYARMFEATKEGGGIYVCHADSSGHVFRGQLLETGWMLKQCLIWVKDAFVLGRQDYHWQHEPILYGWKPGAAHSWYGRRIRTTVLDNETDLTTLKKADLLAILEEIVEASSTIRVDRPRRNAEHPTMKPVQLVARLLANSTKRGDIVLDPFGGSGSTLIAAAQMDRRCFIMEKDARYADVIIRRWENLTNELAHRVGDDGATS